MYAVIRAGGKQFKVATGDVIAVDRLSADEGGDVSFPALLVVDGKKVTSARADLASTTVKGKVVAHTRGEKIRVSTYKAKSGWKRTAGHRADLTRVEITEIG